MSESLGYKDRMCDVGTLLLTGCMKPVDRSPRISNLDGRSLWLIPPGPLRTPIALADRLHLVMLPLLYLL